MNKYRNIKTTLDGITFDSKMEASRYSTLKILLDQGLITNLKTHVRFPLEINGIKVCSYEADFCYFCTQRAKEIIEDVKGVRTALYRLKKKLMKVIYNIEIEEICRERVLKRRKK